MQDVFESVRQKWRREVGQCDQPASPEALRDFQSINGVTLPDDMLNFLREVGGMNESAVSGVGMDENGFLFWLIDDYIPVTDVRARLDYAKHGIESGSQIFLFADVMTWSWLYGIDLQPGDGYGHIYLVGKDKPQLVASDFTSFLRKYMLDSPDLYP